MILPRRQLEQQDRPGRPQVRGRPVGGTDRDRPAQGGEVEGAEAVDVLGRDLDRAVPLEQRQEQLGDARADRPQLQPPPGVHPAHAVGRSAQREQAHVPVVGVCVRVVGAVRVGVVPLDQQAWCQGQPPVVVPADVEDDLGGAAAQLDGAQAGAGDQLDPHPEAALEYRPRERPHVAEGELGRRVVAVGQALRGDVQLADRGPVDGLDPGAGPRAGQVAPGDARARPAPAAPQAAADRPHDEPGRLVPHVPARGQAEL